MHAKKDDDNKAKTSTNLAGSLLGVFGNVIISAKIKWPDVSFWKISYPAMPKM